MKPDQCRAARALLGLSLLELAHLARVADTAIGGFERGQSFLRPEQHRRVRAALIVSGIKFTEDDEFFGVHKKIDLLGDEITSYSIINTNVPAIERQIQLFMNAITDPDTIRDGRLVPKRSAVGVLIERALQHRGLQSKELAVQMKVSSAYVSSILTGKNGLSSVQADKFATALDISADVLLEAQTHERKAKKLVAVIRHALAALADEHDALAAPIPPSDMTTISKI